MTWVLIAVAGWIVLAIGAALLIGRAIALADRRSGESLNFVVDLEAPVFTDGAPAAPPALTPDESAIPEQVDPGPSTVPGIPSARPPLPKPPVPRSTSAQSRREAS